MTNQQAKEHLRALKSQRNRTCSCGGFPARERAARITKLAFAGSAPGRVGGLRDPRRGFSRWLLPSVSEIPMKAAAVTGAPHTR